MLIRDILNQTARKFALAGIPSSRLDAEILLSFCLGCERLDFFKNPSLPVNEEMLASFQKLVARRLAWEPVAYITGHKEFWSFTLEVSPDVLIPRPETELLVEQALPLCRETDGEISILEIGTGSGAIALALAYEMPLARLTATDISGKALAIAAKNAQNLHLDFRIEFLQGDLLEPVDDFFDIIVANPPYIAEAEYGKLPAGVKDYEPLEALLAGDDGLDFYRQIIAQAPGHLKKGGWLLLEIGATQGAKIFNIFQASGEYHDISVSNDYAGLPRIVKARREISG